MSEIPKEELERIEKEAVELYPPEGWTQYHRAVWIAGAKAEHSYLQGRMELTLNEKIELALKKAREEYWGRIAELEEDNKRLSKQLEEKDREIAHQRGLIMILEDEN